MTSPYRYRIPEIPAWGESLGESLSGIGYNLARIINPRLDDELRARKAIEQEPGFLDELITSEKANPGVTEKLYGPRFAKNFVIGKTVSPEYARKQRVAGLQEEYLTGQLTRQRQEIKGEELDLTEKQRLTDWWLALPPEKRNAAYFTQKFGVSSTKYDLIEKEAQGKLDRMGLAEKFKAMKPDELIESLFATDKAGKPLNQLDNEKLQALMEYAPDALSFALRVYGEKGDRLRALISARSGNDVLGRQLLMADKNAALGEWRETSFAGVLPGDIYKVITGRDPREVGLPMSEGGEQRYINQRYIQKVASDIKPVVTQLRLLMSQERRAGANRDEIKALENQQLALLSRATGKSVQWRKQEKLFGDKWELVDINGKKVNDAEFSEFLMRLEAAPETVIQPPISTPPAGSSPPPVTGAEAAVEEAAKLYKAATAKERAEFEKRAAPDFVKRVKERAGVTP